jgi:dTDP-4-dehydrorhamnose reductase
MRVLILGAAGMLGHKLWQRFEPRFDTWVTLRTSFSGYARFGLFHRDRTLDHVDAGNFDSVTRAVATVRPDVIVNAIGIIKQLPAASDPILSLSINSLFPHRLAALGAAAAARVVHVSTDCVFSGRAGGYSEDAASDAEDLYGRTKFLGEITGPHCLTVRTSIIGRELSGSSGLVEWFLSRHGSVRGFTRAMYSGVTTEVFAATLAEILEHHRGISGVHHLSSAPISKYELLCLIRDAYQMPTHIEPDATPRIDRTLDGSRVRAATGLVPPPWPVMVQEMAADPTPYDQWRTSNA